MPQGINKFIQINSWSVQLMATQAVHKAERNATIVRDCLNMLKIARHVLASKTFVVCLSWTSSLHTDSRWEPKQGYGNLFLSPTFWCPWWDIAHYPGNQGENKTCTSQKCSEGSKLLNLEAVTPCLRKTTSCLYSNAKLEMDFQEYSHLRTLMQ